MTSTSSDTRTASSPAAAPAAGADAPAGPAVVAEPSPPNPSPSPGPSPGRGRPRDEAREQAILDAALELLVEVGFDRMSMTSIASRARASKATIYRRWPGKLELVTDAIRRRGGTTTTPPDGGCLRADLLAWLRDLGRSLAEQDVAVFTGVMLAMRDCPELASSLRCQMHDDKLAAATELVERAVARGEPLTDDAATALHEVAPAMFFFRFLVTGEPIDEKFYVGLVDRVLLPLMTRND